MYCSCLRPFPIQNVANGEKFTVCTSGQGGCGLEIKLKETKSLTDYINKDINLDNFFLETEYLCIECNGTGVSARDLITCISCKGTGILV